MTSQFRAFCLCFRQWITEYGVNNVVKVEFPEDNGSSAFLFH